MEKYEEIWNDLKNTFKHNMPTDGYICVGSVVGFMEAFEMKLKPRYTVEKEKLLGDEKCFNIIDNQINDSDNTIITFFAEDIKSFDAKTEARKLCKQLNEKD